MELSNFRLNTNLIASPDVFFFTVEMNTLSDVWRLLLQSHQHIAGLMIKTCKNKKNEKRQTQRKEAIAAYKEPNFKKNVKAFFMILVRVIWVHCRHSDLDKLSWLLWKLLPSFKPLMPLLCKLIFRSRGVFPVGSFRTHCVLSFNGEQKYIVNFLK